MPYAPQGMMGNYASEPGLLEISDTQFTQIVLYTNELHPILKIIKIVCSFVSAISAKMRNDNTASAVTPLGN